MMKKLFTILTALLFFLSSCEQKQRDQSDKIADSERVLEQMMITASERYIKAWNENDIDLMRSVTISDLVRNANGAVTSSNLSGIEETIKYWHAAIPDLKISLDQVVVKDGKTYSGWTCTGTNTGRFGDTPPTGKKIRAAGFTVLTFNEDAKIIRDDAYYDLLGVVEGWGYTLIPPIME